MSIQYTAHQIFDMAQRIEHSGASFYRRAAEIVGVGDNAELLLRLAAMEDAHERVFAALQAALPEREGELGVRRVDEERAPQLQVMVDANVFDIDLDPAERLKGQETTEDILRMAVGLEKDTVVFYVGIQDMVPRDQGRDRVNDIIHAEMSHIALLSNKLLSLGDGK